MSDNTTEPITPQQGFYCTCNTQKNRDTPILYTEQRKNSAGQGF